ncbi:MAG: PQQ-binding-like beta-propeller repeat protein, partial [Planctomycetota bacterium]
SLWTWKPDAPSGLASGSALTGEKLIVGDNRGYVYSLSAQEGKLLDRYPSGAPVTQAPQVVDDMLLVFPRSSGVQCLDVGEEMNLRWSYDSATEFIGQGKQGLYFLTADKQMVCLDGETGDEKWKMQIANGLLVKSQPDKPVFYLASPAGEIVALGELD